MRKVLFVAGEASGDLHAAGVAEVAVWPSRESS
jgi:lipid A disaccharide synthetase